MAETTGLLAAASVTRSRRRWRPVLTRRWRRPGRRRLGPV